MLISQQHGNLAPLIKEVFSEGHLRELARKSGFQQRSSKLLPHQFALAMIFSEGSNNNLSLLDLVAHLHADGANKISKVALHKKFSDQAVDFMNAILLDSINQKIRQDVSDFSTHFSKILIKDSTKFSLQSDYDGEFKSYGNFSKKNGLLSIQFEYDVQTQQMMRLELHPGLRNDKADSNQTLKDLLPGSLYIRDLGYVSGEYLQAFQNNNAYFLNRLPPQASLFTPEGKPISWKEIHSRFSRKKLSFMEMDVLVFKDVKAPCKCIIEPVSKEEYKKRLEKQTTSSNSRHLNLSELQKIRLRYNIFITNAPEEKLSTKNIRRIYYLRWQIELLFKTWKSYYRINEVKVVKKQRLLCQLYGKLILIVIGARLRQIHQKVVSETNTEMGVSILKFNKRVSQLSREIKDLFLGKTNIMIWLEHRYLPLTSDCICNAPKGKETHYKILTFNKIRLS